MAYWWVNHKQTRKHEVDGDYLWSPKLNQNGARNHSYDNMVRAMPGDVVFSYADGVLAAVGTVAAEATTTPKPTEFGHTGTYWSNEGWFLAVEFRAARSSVRPKDFLERIVRWLPPKYSPIQANGNGNQGIYLASIADELGEELLRLTRMDDMHEPLQRVSETPSEYRLDIEKIKQSDETSETQRVQLVQARIGQGFFRAQVLLRHPVCRMTGVSDKRLLRASHIKPWRESSNFERLDGANGIMLSPHVDALFDLGLMSFEDDGQALIRNDVPRDVLERWALPRSNHSAPFEKEQCAYLAEHRKRLGPFGAFTY